jgi:hypothetical protein
MSHVFVHGVHIVDVGRLSASTVLGEVSRFSAVKARAFGMFGSIVLLGWHFCHVAVFRLGEVGVHVVILVLALVIGSPGAGQIHRYLHVVIGWTWGVGGIVDGPLLLLLRSWLILGSSSPCAWSELSLVLSLIVVEPSWVR